MDFTVIATYRCDSRCSMCHAWQHPTLPRDEVTAATLERVPDGIDNLNITGGEPTLRRDLHDLVSVLHSRARTLEISSNGLHADRLERIVRDYPNTKIRFSLETPGVKSDAIRGERDGFARKLAGLRRLKDLGAADIGFAAVIQDDNAAEIVNLYRFAKREGVELATSALHNAFQFHKGDNVPYDRLQVAKHIEAVIVEMLRTRSVKDWFRAYLNLGLIAKTLGQERLIPCTAGSDFLFIDPWSDVYACNVRPDLLIGNLRAQAWEEIVTGEAARRAREKVRACDHNCWMVTSARTAMRNRRVPALPTWRPFRWVVANRIRVALNVPIPFAKYIDYRAIRTDDRATVRTQFLDVHVARTPHAEASDRYAPFGPYFNR